MKINVNSTLVASKSLVTSTVRDALEYLGYKWGAYGYVYDTHPYKTETYRGGMFFCLSKNTRSYHETVARISLDGKLEPGHYELKIEISLDNRFPQSHINALVDIIGERLSGVEEVIDVVFEVRGAFTDTIFTDEPMHIYF